MMQNYYKRLHGDRRDGWKLRNVALFFGVIPYIMRSRLDSQNLYEERIDVEPMMEFLRENRESLPNVTMMTVFIAALVRMLSQRPQLNRFVVHNKLYAHNSIEISIAIKRSMSENGEETMIKPSFDPRDNLLDVQRRLDEAISKAMEPDQDDGIDKVAASLNRLPSWMFRMFSHFIFFADNHGKLAKSLTDASPWHCSAMFTNVGSLGIGPIYHHLTELGTYSVFLAMGKRECSSFYDDKGNEIVKRTVGIKVTNDERICDGYYYATAMRYMRRLLMNPTLLMERPRHVYLDPAVTNPLINDPNACEQMENEHTEEDKACQTV